MTSHIKGAVTRDCFFWVLDWTLGKIFSPEQCSTETGLPEWLLNLHSWLFSRPRYGHSWPDVVVGIVLLWAGWWTRWSPEVLPANIFNVLSPPQQKDKNWECSYACAGRTATLMSSKTYYHVGFVPDLIYGSWCFLIKDVAFSSRMSTSNIT